MKKIELDIVALSHSVTQSANYVVVLGERRGRAGCPSSSARRPAGHRGGHGTHGAQLPLTHDLFKNTIPHLRRDAPRGADQQPFGRHFLRKTGLQPQRGIRRDRLPHFRCDRDGRALQLPDLHLRFYFGSRRGRPRRRRGRTKSGRRRERTIERSDSIENMPTESLRNLLEDVLANEDYEKAAAIRDELKKRW